MATTGIVTALVQMLENDSIEQQVDEKELIPFEIIATLLIPFLREDRVKIKEFVELTVPMYSTHQFRRFFRMSATTFEHILTRLSRFPQMQSEYASGRPPVSLEKKLLMTLWYLGNQESVRSISDRFDVADSTFLNHVRKTMNCVTTLNIIKFPTAAEQVEIKRKFEEAGFPNTIGAIDGSHIPIKAPADDQMSYYNRKSFTSIILQAVCTGNMMFSDIYGGWPGKVHDARVFRNSPLYNQGARLCGPYHIVGDSAYPLTEWLMTPYRDNGHLTRAQRNYNFHHASARCVIERAFALLKGRFHRLKYIDANSIELIVKMIECASYLHNICILESDKVADMISEYDHEGNPDNELNDHNDHNHPRVHRNALLKREMITGQC